MPDWPWPDVRELVVVPLAEGDRSFGWLLAFNHVSGGEFGTVEASMLSSVGAILGIHNGNAELYQQQREIFRRSGAGPDLGHRRQGSLHLRS